MTNKEMIKVLREEGVTMCHISDYFPEIANRLEALIAENDLLYREVAQLKAECDHFRDLTKKLWCEKRYCKGWNVPSTEETP